MNKKGAEWPSFLIHTIFTMLLFMIGVFMILDLVRTENVAFNKDVDLFNFGLRASRLLNSADCLAWEEQTTSGTLVHAGIVDVSKLYQLRPDDCVKGSKWLVSARYKNENGQELKAENHDPDVNLANDIPRYNGKNMDPLTEYDWFAVKIYDSGKLYDGRVLVAVK